jgi:hypothetical protein
LVTAIDGVIKAIVRRFIPNWLDLETTPDTPPVIPPTILFLLVCLPFLSGCFDSPPAVMKGHDAAATCVQRASQNYQETIAGLAAALRSERRARVEYALQKSMDNVRLLAAKDGGKIDAEKVLKYVQEAYATRDQELAATEAVIAKFGKSAADGDREAALALSLMGELRKYDAAGVNPEAVVSEVSSYFVPLPKPEDFPEK